MCTSIERDRRGINYKGKWEEREQGWRSDESTRLPPMLPGFKSLRRRHMWVEFVVGSLLCSERFFSGDSGGFPHSSKPTFSNSNSIWNARTRLNEFIWILFASLRDKIGIYKFFLQFTILGGWVKKTKIGRLIYKNHLSFVFATAGGCKFPFGSSFSFSFPLIVITSSCSLLAPGSRSPHFVINFSLLICNILATLYMLNF